MNKVGHPKFQYKIPYDEDWYIILTSNKYHFYFNVKQKVSYWQLSDIFQNFLDIDKAKFINSIDFNQLAILFAKNNGLKGIDDYYLKKWEKIDRNDAKKNKQENERQKEEPKNEVVEKEETGEDEVDEVDESIDETSDLDQKESNDIIKELLREQGLLKEQEESEDKPGLVTGYSSSEDEDELENEDEVEIENEQEDQDTLQLDLDAEPDKKADFIALLNKLESKISIYEPWNMIEEELIEELVTFPEYYSIDSKIEREQIFNEWCSSKSNETEKANPESIHEPIHEGSDDKFPTNKLTFLLFLQNYKSQLKKLYYPEFYNKYHQEVSEIPLNNNTKQTIYSQYRTFLNDFAIEEKTMRKSKKYDANTNLKKLKLQNYLKSQKLTNLNKDDYLVCLEKVKQNDNNHWQNWLILLNTMNFSENLVEDVPNFIVGDEKRVDCYLERLQFHFQGK